MAEAKKKKVSVSVKTLIEKPKKAGVIIINKIPKYAFSFSLNSSWKNLKRIIKLIITNKNEMLLKRNSSGTWL